MARGPPSSQPDRSCGQRGEGNSSGAEQTCHALRLRHPRITHPAARFRAPTGARYPPATRVPGSSDARPGCTREASKEAKTLPWQMLPDRWSFRDLEALVERSRLMLARPPRVPKVQSAHESANPQRVSRVSVRCTRSPWLSPPVRQQTWWQSQTQERGEQGFAAPGASHQPSNPTSPTGRGTL